jgi:putative membrane protein insertion efficiency factor
MGENNKAIIREIVKVMKTAILLLINIYQMTRAFRLSCCRFYPSCSDYAIQSIEKHGIAKGLFLALNRIIKCHPWHQGGVDTVEL